MLECLAVILCFLLLVALPVVAEMPASRQGVTLYVSKLGRNTDGRSWQTAFTTIQAALEAIPDDQGGHRVLIRPDTYFENNLFVAHKGAAGAYNEIKGDHDGSLGSGTSGWVIIDSGDPGQQGFKSYDWWGPFKSYAQGWSPEHTDSTFSAICWDRWSFRHLYVTGGDAGIFFDGTNQVEPFSVLVEDCVSIGRAFGGGVANVLSRPNEPITFRRCHLWALDFWGDTAGAYVRVENQTMPDQPDAVFEDCVMVGPQCALKASNFGYFTSTRVRCTRSNLVALNFSQPVGTPTDGVIQSVQEGRLLHIELEDSLIMGYKVCGVIVNKETAKDLSFTLRGNVRAYVQYQQEVPQGFHRLADWPVEAFAALSPPAHLRPTAFTNRELLTRDLCELSPFIWQGRLCHMECVRPGSGGQAHDYYLRFLDVATGEELGRGARGYGLASILIHEERAYVFASRWSESGWEDVTLFQSSDLKHWHSSLAVQGENEGLFNTSVCKGPAGFVMAYESSDPTYPAFTIKFAQSTDLLTWTKIPEATFGTNRYTACPCLRYADGYYYCLYLEHRTPRWQFETYITRSRDLKHWELSSANPVIFPQGLDEGINASDPELVQWQGQTYLYYAAGNQLNWMNLKRALFPGSMQRFLQSFFISPGIPDWGSASAPPL